MFVLVFIIIIIKIACKTTICRKCTDVASVLASDKIQIQFVILSPITYCLHKPTSQKYKKNFIKTFKLDSHTQI